MPYWGKIPAVVATMILAMGLLAACNLELEGAPADEEDEGAPTEVNGNEESTSSGSEDSSEDGEAAETATEREATEEATDDTAVEVSDEEEEGEYGLRNRRKDDREYDEPPEVEAIESNIDVEVTADDYTPEGNVLFALHGEMDPELYLVSPEGEVVEAWRINNRFDVSLLERRVLPNGNIMFVIQGDGAYEMNRDGEIVWAYEHGGLSHHGEILPNGNVLVAGSVCDCILELDYDTQEPVFYWDAHQAFPDYSEGGEAYEDGDGWGMQNLFRSHYDPDLEYPSTWGHANYTQKLENDHYIVSLRNFDTVLEINQDGETVWSYGPGIIKHQHTPVDLGDGTMLIFDNGNNRAIQIERGTGEILWSYDNLESAIMGDVNLLDDGNYKVVDSLQFRVDVVSPEEEQLWSMQIETEENANGIYRAHFPDLEN